jgi:hypothetical protein
MKYEIKQLKNLISKAKPQEILVLAVNKLEKDSVNTNLKLVENFIKKSEDCVIMVIKK